MNPVILKIAFIVSLIAITIVAVYFFLQLPVGTQKKKIKEWLLMAVTEAEKELGSGTGQIKLRVVYDAFVSTFKFASVFLSFESFSMWVDEALCKMRELISQNHNVEEYVTKGDSGI